jgi:hypothetical protein
VVSEAPESDSGSRRRLLQAGAAAAAAMVTAGCGKPSLREQLKRDPTVAKADVEVLLGLLEVERMGIAIYTAGGPLLPAAAVPAAKQFLAQELAHAGGLIGLIRAAGSKAPMPREGSDLGRPRSGREVLELIHTAERAQVSAYLQSIPRLAPGPVRTQVAGYFANDAQHLSSVRFLLGEAALVAPLVTGRE